VTIRDTRAPVLTAMKRVYEWGGGGGVYINMYNLVEGRFDVIEGTIRRGRCDPYVRHFSASKSHNCNYFIYVKENNLPCTVPSFDATVVDHLVCPCLDHYHGKSHRNARLLHTMPPLLSDTKRQKRSPRMIS
jgi:hypothetical protein